MSLIPTIVYDPAVIAAMSTELLLCQMIARMDMRTPKREESIRAKEILEELELKARGFAAEISELGVPSLQKDLDLIVEKYFGQPAATAAEVVA